MQIMTPPTPPYFTSIVLNGINVTINFTAGASDAASTFTLISSATAGPSGGYAPVAGASITNISPGVFQTTTAVNGATRFYRLER